MLETRHLIKLEHRKYVSKWLWFAILTTITALVGLCSGTHTTAKMSTLITICFEHAASFMTGVAQKVGITIVGLRQIAGLLWLSKRSMTNLNEITARRNRKISRSKAVHNETFASVNPKKWVRRLAAQF